MTSPFDWKNRASTLVKDIQKGEIQRRNANGNKSVSLKPRTFNTYQRAVPSGKAPQ